MHMKGDKQSSITLARNPFSIGNSCHIEIKYHFFRDQVRRGKFEAINYNTEI